MRYYKEIRFCRVCKERFVVQDRSKSYYCDKCQKKYNDYRKKKLKEEEKDGRNS